MNERARPEAVGTRTGAPLENSAFFMPFSMNRHFKKSPRLITGAEGIEGTMAFMQKRPPKWAQ